VANRQSDASSKRFRVFCFYKICFFYNNYESSYFTRIVYWECGTHRKHLPAPDIQLSGLPKRAKLRSIKTVAASKRRSLNKSGNKIGTKNTYISKRSRGILGLLGTFWGVFIIAGFVILAREEFTPVKAAPPVTLFPRSSDLQLASDKDTLVLFVHPHCPCTRASLHELVGLLAESQNRVSANIVFTIPNGVPTGWEEGDLWNSARSLPGLRVVRDQGGGEARRFEVAGSGHVLLYNPSGKLLFSGGITASRGHEGENLGRFAIVSFILNGHAPVNHTPVFGCSLL
jgi:hypothetical protein